MEPVTPPIDLQDPNELIKLKQNPDIFYYTLSQLENNELRYLCRSNKEFLKLCKSESFWETYSEKDLVQCHLKKDIKENME
jgi:hypothetical protein